MKKIVLVTSDGSYNVPFVDCIEKRLQAECLIYSDLDVALRCVIQDKDVELVISEVYLAEENAFNLAKRIFIERDGIRVIIMSDLDPDNLVYIARTRGIDERKVDFIRKNNISDLAKLLNIPHVQEVEAKTLKEEFKEQYEKKLEVYQEYWDKVREEMPAVVEEIAKKIKEILRGEIQADLKEADYCEPKGNYCVNFYLGLNQYRELALFYKYKKTYTYIKCAKYTLDNEQYYNAIYNGIDMYFNHDHTEEDITIEKHDRKKDSDIFRYEAWIDLE